MKLNNIWGYGQLFGYSAFDGPNRYNEDNILMLMKEPLTFRFEYQPYYILMSFKGFKDVTFEAIMSDFVIAYIDGTKFLLTFIDNDTLIIKSKILPTFIGEKDLKISKHNDFDIYEIENHYLYVKYEKLNDGYLIVVHHSLSIDNSLDISLNKYDINALIKDKISYYEKMPKCLDPKYESLYYKALSVNKVNTHSKEGNIDDFWTTPDRVPHRHMWMWDSAFHAMTIVHYNQEAAKKALFSMLKQTKEDGFMPHFITPTGNSEVTQPCVMSYGTWYVYEVTKDKEFLKQCLPYLEKYLKYDIKNRDKNNNGLLEWITEPDNPKCKCGESGLDNSPRFDFDDDMDAVDFSTYLALDSMYLSKIYKELGNLDKANEWMNIHNNVTKKINDLMWDEETGVYYDRLFSGKLTKVLTPTSFFPMFANVPSKVQAEKMVKTLTNKELLWTTNPVSTISQKDPRFCNDMWRGGVWLNCNFFIIEGLMNYGYIDLANQLRNITLDFVNKWYLDSGCIFEFFDPANKVSPLKCDRKGKPLDPPDHRKKMHAITDFNWSACFTILLIQNKY